MAENINNEIPENADKVLFAEDLISYLMLRNARFQYLGRTAERYREFVNNRFDRTTRRAINFMDVTMEMQHDDIFLYMQNLNSVNHETYRRFANDIGAKYFPEGFDANNFLHYCVHLASLAAYFYNNGILEAPNLAVEYIVRAIQNIDMATGGWDTLSEVAQRYSSLAQDSMDMLSPIDSDEDIADIVVPERVAEADHFADGDSGFRDEHYLVPITRESNNQAAQGHSGASGGSGSATRSIFWPDAASLKNEPERSRSDNATPKNIDFKESGSQRESFAINNSLNPGPSRVVNIAFNPGPSCAANEGAIAGTSFADQNAIFGRKYDAKRKPDQSPGNENNPKIQNTNIGDEVGDTVQSEPLDLRMFSPMSSDSEL